MAREGQLWYGTPGPSAFVEKICGSLMGKRTAWIEGDVSWGEDLHRLVRERISLIDSAIRMEFIDASELSTDAIGLIRRYDDVAARDFLPAMDLVEFLREKRILETTVLWLYHVDGQKGKRWLEFSRALAKRGASLKVVCQGTAVTGVYKNVELFCQSRFLTPFDDLLFAMTLIRNSDWNMELKEYACRLAADLAESNAEGIAALLSDQASFVRDPISGAERLLHGADLERIRNAVRSAQLRSLLPKLEILRGKLIAKLHDRFRTLVPFQDDYGHQIDRPEDMELRHMVYYENLGEIRLLPDEHDLLRFLYTIRNDMAHGKLIDGSRAIKCLEL